ncbi:MAG: cytochrome c oxidase subunit II [Euryarchaeota archaeon RBG_16_68_13]|nr:MAG: cytochrome c oxidase subunit II [Euryarchaeota archaeon RBG_16_68_13]
MSILRRWGLTGPGLSVIGFGSATPAAAAANTPGQEAIDNLFGIVLLFAVAIVIFVQVLLVIVVFRFRKRKGHTQSVPNPITHHTGLEAAWTIVPALILLFVGIMMFQTLAVTDTIPQNPDVVVRVIGHQWFWEFVVDDGSGNVTTTVGEFTVRAGQVVKIIVESSDVAHSFYIDDFALKVDAIPGHENVYWFQAQNPGDFDVTCAEFCGQNHRLMIGKLHVLPA